MLNLSSVNDTKDIATKEYVDGKTVVTGVKGNSESSYRTGNVNLTAANVGAIAKNAECLTTNPFRTPTFDGIYISKIDNGLYAADKRWNVTYTGTSVSGSVANLFDGNYDSRLQITKSTTGVVLVNFANTTYFPGYPYGYILVSFYYNEQPESVSGRVYCNHSSQGVGWKTISFTRVSDSTTTACVYRSEHQGYYNISQMEITVVAGSSSVAGVNQIEIHLDRPHPSYTPFVSKYAAETLYYNLTAPKFIGALQGNADTATNATKVNNHTVNADVPSGAKFTDTTYDPLTASEANTGTSTTARTISAKVLADYVASHGGDTPFPLDITDQDIDLSTTPSTARYDQTLRGLDANGDVIWAVDSVHDTSGAHGFQLNSFGGNNQNSLQMLMKPDGTAAMWISQPAVWRNALGAAASSHVHGNITSSGDITAAAPTVASGDCIVINDDSASKITNGPAFDVNDTTKYLRHDGTWGTPAGGSGSDTKVTQTLVADNNYYPLLLAPHGQSATTTTTANFSTKAGFNPSASMFGIGTDADYIYMKPNLTGSVAEILLGVYSESYGDEFEYKIDGEAFNQSSYLHISTDKAIADYIASQGGGGGRQATRYATCSTTASTAAKVITVTGWTPTAGDILTVLFTTANTAATPTLKVNSLGAKSIYIGNATPNSTTNVLKWSANTTITFMYDGTYYRYLGMETAATNAQGGGTWYGTSSTAATTAAKTSTITNFKLTPGAVVCIKFSTANTYANGAITLNVSSTGAKTIYVNNAATSATNPLFWDVGDIVTFIYSGSYWYFVSSSNHYGERMELLWTNPNPTTSMSTQTLTLTDGYDAFIITSTATADYGVLATEMIPAGVTVNISAPNYSATGLYRAVTTTRTSVAFSVGSSADHVIPRYVWGVKNDTQTPTITVLYDDATGTTSDITLSSSAANFDHMKIYFKKSNGQRQCASVDIFSPNQKYADLTVFEPSSSNSGMWFASRQVYINGTSITTNNNANGFIGGSPSGGNANEVVIYRVEAW